MMKFCVFLLVALQFVSISSFMQLRNRIVKQTACIHANLLPSIETPTTANSRLTVTISGPSISSALFRAELKKELCFFRGCRALFSAPDNLSGLSVLTCEGKTTQIVRFLTWLEQLSTEVSDRKANFQGPSLVAYIDKMSWEDYTGEMASGFQSAEAAPSLSVNADDVSGGQREEAGVMEARSMTGTDESV